MKGYMEFYFRRVFFKTNIYTHVIYRTMLPGRRERTMKNYENNIFTNGNN